MKKTIIFFCDYRGTFVANDGVLQSDEINRFANNLENIANRENAEVFFSFVTMDEYSDITEAYRLLEEQLTSNVKMGYQICSDGIFEGERKAFSFSSNSKADGMRFLLEKKLSGLNIGKVYYFDDSEMNIMLAKLLCNNLNFVFRIGLSNPKEGLASVNESVEGAFGKRAS